jgi:hypothetical protein
VRNTRFTFDNISLHLLHMSTNTTFRLIVALVVLVKNKASVLLSTVCNNLSIGFALACSVHSHVVSFTGLVSPATTRSHAAANCLIVLLGASVHLVWVCFSPIPLLPCLDGTALLGRRRLPLFFLLRYQQFGHRGGSHLCSSLSRRINNKCRCGFCTSFIFYIRPQEADYRLMPFNFSVM